MLLDRVIRGVGEADLDGNDSKSSRLYFFFFSFFCVVSDLTVLKTESGSDSGCGLHMSEPDSTGRFSEAGLPE